MTKAGHDKAMEILADRWQQDDAMQQGLEALYSALNIEGPAVVAGEQFGAFKGLDVPWHFAEIRKAIKAIEALGFEPR